MKVMNVQLLINIKALEQAESVDSLKPCSKLRAYNCHVMV